jgi:hypothetical protein
MKIDVTVIIPTKNDYQNLKTAISNLISFSQVVIIDSLNDINTKNLVDSYGFEYVHFQWNGIYPKKRNWVLDNYHIKNKWVLFLDSDEFISTEFINEIQNTLNNSTCDAYILNYSNFFLGKELFYGEKMKKIALFKNYLRYEKIDVTDNTGFDMEIHEHPIGFKNLGEIKTKIFHHDFKGLSHYLHKHNLYSDWESNRLHSKLDPKFLTTKQRIKYKILKTPFGCLIYFIYFYFFKFGFLDGSRGFVFIILKSYYFFIIYIKFKFSKNIQYE